MASVELQLREGLLYIVAQNGNVTNMTNVLGTRSLIRNLRLQKTNNALDRRQGHCSRSDGHKKILNTNHYNLNVI